MTKIGRRTTGKQIENLMKEAGLAHFDGLSLAMRLHTVILKLIPPRADLLDKAFTYSYTAFSLPNAEETRIIAEANEFKEAKGFEMEEARALEHEIDPYIVNVDLLIVRLSVVTNVKISFVNIVSSLESIHKAIDSMARCLHFLLRNLEHVAPPIVPSQEKTG